MCFINNDNKVFVFHDSQDDEDDCTFDPQGRDEGVGVLGRGGGNDITRGVCVCVLLKVSWG